jgi:hypothetical protein
MLGLAPPQNEEQKETNFLYGLKNHKVIDHLTFAIYLSSEDDVKSNIKFGSYDTIGLESQNTSLTLLRTINTTTWATYAKDFTINGSIVEFDTVRQAVVEPSSPFIYLPTSDFFKV